MARRETSPSGADAGLDRAIELERRGRLQEAYQAYQRLLTAVPAHAEAHHRLGLLLHQSAGRHAEAAEHIERAVAAAPGNAIYRSNLGVALKAAGQLEAAVAAYQGALALAPHLAATRSNLGVALLALGRVDEAIAAQRQALADDPRHAEAHANLGLALLQAGDTAGAIEAHGRAIALRPGYANAHLYLAEALLTADRAEEAEASARQAVALAPQHAGAHHALGLALARLGRLDVAAASYRAAIGIAPEAGAFRNLGEVLNRLGEHAEAVRSFRASLELDEASAAAHAGLGFAQSELGGMPRALDSYRRALALEPGNDRYRQGAAAAALAVGRLEEATALYGEILSSSPDSLEALGALVFVSNYRAELPPEATARQAEAFGHLLAGANSPRTRHPNEPDPARRLRVGLVSGDFRQHPVAAFLAGPLAAIDPRQVELFAYATRAGHDEVTERLRGVVPNWREAARLGDDELAQRIAGDGIDILVDLSGFTTGARPAVFARRPAPIAITWLGYSGTTGNPGIDYVLADAVVAPPAEENLFSETVWRLPDAYLCYTPPEEVDEVAPLPALANRQVTFGSFNNLNKLSDPTVALWARVLVAVPTARLALKATALRRPEAADDVRARFAAAGVAADRLLLLGYEAEARDHLAAYRHVDIGLDPFPYNGTTTTCEAMLMGVPVLTLRGDRFIAHVGESLNRAVGLDEWVAADAEDFVRKAVAFAADLPRVAALRAALRPRLIASPLGDAPRFARHLEAAFRGMWRGWCVGQGARADWPLLGGGGIA